MMNAPWAEPSLRDLEPASFAEQQVLRRHAHVIEPHFEVTVRRMVIAEHRQMPHDGDAGRLRRQR